MAHINKSALTKIEIVRISSKMFLENGYTATSAKAICSELGISTGNLTFHFPTKEHLLATLVDLLCRFQWKTIKRETKEGLTAIMAVCLEIATMVVICEEDAIARDFYLSAYTSPMVLDIIRKNDKERAKSVFAKYCKGWSDEQFAEAEVLVSGVEYATLMTTESSAPTEYQIEGAMRTILTIYNVPEEMQKKKIEKIFTMDYRKIARRMFDDFKRYVAETNKNTFMRIVDGHRDKRSTLEQ